MWWGIALGMVLAEVLRAAGDYVWRRWWGVNLKGRQGEQVRYW